MRLAITFALLATPLHAWEFTASPVCTVTHETPDAALAMTYDPRQPDPYAIAITLGAAPWPGDPLFAIRFEGPSGLTISTDRQRLSDGDRTLTVSDTGFGNVLDGLEFNDTAVALSGAAQVGFPLSGAAPAIRAFRACADGGLA